MKYEANIDRYSGDMIYRRSGRSGLKLPAISLGMWQNFGADSDYSSNVEIVTSAFDNGITYFDLANNYGPPPGSAEAGFGRIFKENLKPWRDEIIVSTKAGYDMWPGPYGSWGSRKYLVASCDQSLRRMGLDYVDIFYSHRYDPETPLEETMGALDHIIRSGRAMYAALSNYPLEPFLRAVSILNNLGTPCVVHQIKYSMLVREWGESLFGVQEREGVGCVSFSPLAQGLLSDKYLEGIPKDSRAVKSGTLSAKFIQANIGKVTALSEIAALRKQTLPQMAISWQLRNDNITSVLVGVRSKKQLLENIGALDYIAFSEEEEERINGILEG